MYQMKEITKSVIRLREVNLVSRLRKDKEEKEVMA